MKKKIALYIIGILYIIIFIKYDIGIPCIFHKITGLYCPGCGGTRAIASLLKLDFYQALRYNLIITISIPFVIIYLLNKKQNKKSNIILYIYLAIIIIFGILRNISDFSFLEPTHII